MVENLELSEMSPQTRKRKSATPVLSEEAVSLIPKDDSDNKKQHEQPMQLQRWEELRKHSETLVVILLIYMCSFVAAVRLSSPSLEHERG